METTPFKTHHYVPIMYQYRIYYVPKQTRNDTLSIPKDYLTMNNKSPEITFVFDRKKAATPTVMSPVEIRAKYNYQQKFLSTGIKLDST